MFEVIDLSIHYGPLHAVRGVSFQVAQKEIVCLVGPNGVGKSTTILALAGVLPLSAGSIMLHGKTISGLPPEKVVRHGLSLVPEGRHIFSDLTVRENLILPSGIRKDKEAFKRDLEYVYGLFPILDKRRNQSAGTLSGGEQQQLAIGRALLTSPRLLVIDEPALGLAPLIIDQVYKALLDLRRDGVTMLIVEQSTDRALEMADRLYFMQSGLIVLSGRSDDLKAKGGIEDTYFGGKLKGQGV